MRKERLVYGVGINDAGYGVYRKEKVNGKLKVIWTCPYYRKWKGMLERCYSEREQEKHPTYKGCSVCDEWLTFSNFRKWMESQDWKGRQLDKDLLTEGNKVYSPSTCVFIPSNLNKFIITSGAARGEYALGVCYRKEKGYYISQIKNGGCRVHLGVFTSQKQAHHRYLKEKLRQCLSYIEEFKGEPFTVKGLIRIKDKIQYHIDNNLELTSF